MRRNRGDVAMALSLFYLILTNFGVWVVASSSQTCYFPDQSIANGFIPCNSKALGTQNSASACCPDQDNAYCTDGGLCIIDGSLSRGGCTDITFSNKACPSQCTNNIKGNRINLFTCPAAAGAPIYGCGDGKGRPDCASGNFTLTPQHILLRDSQQPGGSEQVNYSDPSVTFINKASIPTTYLQSSPSSASTTSPSSVSTKSNPSAFTIGLALGLPLGILLIISIALNILQFRHYQINIARHSGRMLSRRSGGGDRRGIQRPGSSASILVPQSTRAPGESSNASEGGESRNAVRDLDSEAAIIRRYLIQQQQQQQGGRTLPNATHEHRPSGSDSDSNSTPHHGSVSQHQRLQQSQQRIPSARRTQTQTRRSRPPTYSQTNPSHPSSSLPSVPQRHHGHDNTTTSGSRSRRSSVTASSTTEIHELANPAIHSARVSYQTPYYPNNNNDTFNSVENTVFNGFNSEGAGEDMGPAGRAGNAGATGHSDGGEGGEEEEEEEEEEGEEGLYDNDDEDGHGRGHNPEPYGPTVMGRSEKWRDLY